MPRRWRRARPFRDRACRLMEIMGEGLEAAQGDFLSAVLERGLEGTNRWNGQFFTPPSVAHLMGRVILPRPRTGWVESICDPCCGCGSLPIAGAAGYLDRGGRKDDLLLDVTDIDDGSVCACFVQCSALAIACRAQAMDTLRLEPRGPMMVNPFYVMYGIPARMRLQRAVETMDAALKAAPQKPAEIAQDAPEAGEGSGGAPEAGNATGRDLEGTEGQNGGDGTARPLPPPQQAAGRTRGHFGQGAAAPVQGVLPGFE